MNISKKIASLLALFLIMMSTAMPMTNLNAANIDYTTGDFYLTDRDGNKVSEVNVNEGEPFEIGLAREKTDEVKLEVEIPEGVELQQDETNEINQNGNTQIMYSAEARNIIVSYGEVDADENYTSQEEISDDVVSLIFEITETFDANVDNEVVAKQVTSEGTVRSEPLYLLKSKAPEDEKEFEEIFVGDNGEDTVTDDAKVELDAEENKSVISERSDELRVVKNANVSEIEVGTEFLYTITTSNLTGDETDIAVLDKLPTGIEYVPGTTIIDGHLQSDKDLWNSNVMTAVSSDIGAGNDNKIIFRARANGKQLGVLTNTAKSSSKNNYRAEDFANVEVKERDPGQILVEKTASKKVAEFDEEFTYTIKTTNLTDETTDIATLDKLPKGLDYIPGTTEIDGESQKDTGLWNGNVMTAVVYDLKVGKSSEITFTVKANGEVDGNVTNEARSSASNEVKGTDVEYVEILDNSLDVKKVAVDGNGKKVSQVKKNEEYNYQITISNTRVGRDVTDVEVLDKLPDGISYVSGTTSINDRLISDNLVWSGKTLSVILVEIAGGDSAKIQFKVTVNADVGETVQNVAVVNDELEAESLVQIIPNFTITKNLVNENYGTIDHVEMGDVVYYMLTIRNDDDIKSDDIIVKDKLADYLEYQPGTTTMSGNQLADATVWSDNTLRVKTSLGAHQFTFIRFGIKVDGDNGNNMIVNTAQIGVEDVENPGEPYRPINVTHEMVVSKPEFSISMTAKNRGTDQIIDQVSYSQQYDYEIIVTNSSDDVAGSDILLSDHLPDGIKYIPGSTYINGSQQSDVGIWNSGNDQMGLTLPRVGTNETIKIRITTRVDKKTNGEIENSVSLLDSINKIEMEAASAVDLSPELKIQKQLLDENNKELNQVQLRQVAYYQLTIENVDDNVSVNNIVVEDELADYLEYQIGTTRINNVLVADGDVWKGDKLTVVTDLQPGEIRYIRFGIKVLDDDGSGKIVNTASIGYRDLATGEIKNPIEVTLETPVIRPDLSLEKTAVNTDGEKIINIDRGQSYYYELRIQNNSLTNTAKEVHVSDELPKGISYVKNTTTVDGVTVDDQYWNEDAFDLTFDEIAVNTVKIIKFKVQVDGNKHGTIKNIASMNSDITAASEINVNPNLYIDKTARDSEGSNVGNVEIGDNIYYQIVVRNNDLLAAEDLIFQDELASYLEYVPNTTRINGILQNDGDLWKANTLKIGMDLSPEEFRIVTFTAKINGADDDGNVVNTGVIGFRDPDDQSNIITPVKSTYVISLKSEDLQVLKQARKPDGSITASTEIGEILTYELIVTNPSKVAAARNLEIVDELEEYLVYQEKTTTINGVRVSDALVWNGSVFNYVTDISPSQSLVIRFNVLVTGGNEESFTVYNEMTVINGQETLVAVSELLLTGRK